MSMPHFTDLAEQWVALCPARALGRGRPLSFVLAGVRVLLFRDGAGVAQALWDRCPHRGVALSLGRIVDGAIECPFHGWRFDGDGRCLHVPWNPDARRETLGATALPLRERGGVLWLYTGPEARGEPAVPAPLLRDDVRITAREYLWDAHWTRVMENMLDAPHLPFVHARTIGKRLRSRTARSMQLLWQENAHGADIVTIRPDEEPRTFLRYHYPNAMEMIIDPRGRLLRLFAICNPAGAGQTRLTLYTVRNFAKAALFDPLFVRANARVAAEDRPIIESAQPFAAPLPAREKSVATDAPTLAFRKIWFTRIRRQPGDGA